jgi:hypothetical protein
MIAEVNEQGPREQARAWAERRRSRPRDERWLIEQDKAVDAAESIRSSLPTRGLSLWLFGGRAKVWHGQIVMGD